MIKPILFNTEMVRAIMNGRKTVTRREIKDINPQFERCEKPEREEVNEQVDSKK